jgi:hypothetical protein
VYYPSLKGYCIPLIVSVVRRWQWEHGQHQLLCSHLLQAAVVKSWRPSESTKGKEKVSDLQATRLNTFFVFVWLPVNNRLRVPVEGSAWHIDFVQHLFGQEFPRSENAQWTGYVRSLTQRELDATQASFVLACTKPRGAPSIHSACDCTTIQPKDRHSIRLSQIITRGSAERVLGSIRELAEMENDKLLPSS